MSLPTYPFAKERYWIETGRRELVNGNSGAVLHPLLHRNTSDLSEQRYSSTFSGEEFFLAEHQVKLPGEAEQKVLPGVAYLEMARAAIEQASPMHSESAVLELQDTVWVKPLVVSEIRQVSIALHVNEKEEIEYEVYSQGNEEEVVHCQGRGVWSNGAAPARLDLEQIKAQMGRGEI